MNAEMERVSGSTNDTAPQQKSGPTEKTSEMDRAVAGARRVPSGKDAVTHTIAAGLGLSSESTATVVFPLSETV